MNNSKRKPPPGFSGLWVCEVAGTRFETDYVDGVPHGAFRRISADGTIVREGEVRNGLYHGQHIVRQSNGTLLDKSEFVDGCGIYRIFTSDGRLGWEIPLRYGKRHGIVRRLVQGSWLEEDYRDGIRVAKSDPSDIT